MGPKWVWVLGNVSKYDSSLLWDTGLQSFIANTRTVENSSDVIISDAKVVPEKLRIQDSAIKPLLLWSQQ